MQGTDTLPPNSMSCARKSKPKRQVRHRGIVRAAAALGVTRQHLYLVLEHRRDSKPLLRRFRDYQQAQRNQAAAPTPS